MPILTRLTSAVRGGLVTAALVLLAGCGSDGEPSSAAPPVAAEARLAEGWATYGGGHLRRFFNASETRITRANVATMRPKWTYRTAAIVTASPAVAWIDTPAEGRIKVVFANSWDGHLYALRASNGSRLWSFAMKPHPGASFPQASSPEVSVVAGEQRVYVGGGMTMYCLAAATGELRWQFDAGTGCTDCGPRLERNQIESSPAVVGNLVYFGMDINDRVPGKGGVFAVDAADGHLVWYFDVETAATCRPLNSDRVTRFDGFHTEAELGLPVGFLASRPGCNFDRTQTACGNVWSSFAVDRQRRLIYTASSNCDTDDDPDTADPPPPMPLHDEAVLALDFDGNSRWTWRPREVDNGDLSWGAVPNLFEIEFGGARREVLGVGNKDGVYYVLDRDGVNAISGRIEPYWQTKTVPGGAIGGIIASAAVDGARIWFTTAIGLSINNPQRPAAWSLNASDGALRWSNRSAAPSYAATTAVPTVTFMGSLFGGVVARDADTGDALITLPPIGPVASAVSVLDGELFFGAGVGDRGGNADGEAYQTSLSPSPISAWCLPDAPDCPATQCDDGDPCTYDFHTPNGCHSEAAPDGLLCPNPDVGPSQCRAGQCAS